eukprot:gene26718-35017_t
MTVCCCTPDEEKQVFGCVLFHFQCGLCPIKCCDYDNDGMCWGCVCCACQVDPCVFPRLAVKSLCFCVPCGCISEKFCLTAFCCNPGNETVDRPGNF